jgi:hypothetical protein
VSLIAELKRRRVFRALVGYGVASFAVLQISAAARDEPPGALNSC